eukprot:TRINITY_DN598_c1_g1_i1.p1 TRINITY_DN598_c1_g1~~TRINITY_DN598_c1_g1_i1.p1  ORF type:complete len:121 (-),score=17.28 TRINITY_DN598_c1_g1_i1:94-456(-)
MAEWIGKHDFDLKEDQAPSAALEGALRGGERMPTAKNDSRFPYTNQSKHCWFSYVEFHRCVRMANGEMTGPNDPGSCLPLRRQYHSLCPSEWIEKWDEQRENGTFPGPAFVNADWQPEQK